MVVGMIASSLGHAREASSLLQSMGMPSGHSKEHSVDLANQFLQMSNGQNWTKDEKTAMVPLLSSLVTSYEEQLDQEHSADQNTWDDEAAKFTACYTTSSAKFMDGGSVDQERQLLEEYKAKFKACSSVDKSFEDYKAKSVCTSQTYSFGIGTTHDVELKNALAHMESEVQKYHSTAPENRLSWNKAITVDGSGCGEDQMHMEIQMCEGRKAHRWACESESDCVSSVNLQSTKVRLEGQAQARRDAKLSFKKTMCEVYHVLDMTVEGQWQGSSTSESSCDDLTLDASDLILDLTEPEAEPHCNDPEVTIYPSTSDSEQCSKWLDEAFGAWDSNSVTIPDTCKITCFEDPKPLPCHSVRKTSDPEGTYCYPNDVPVGSPGLLYKYGMTSPEKCAEAILHDDRCNHEIFSDYGPAQGQACMCIPTGYGSGTCSNKRTQSTSVQIYEIHLC